MEKGFFFGNILMSATVGLGTLVILVGMFLFLTPGIQKSKYDAICDPYFMSLVANGNLSSAQKTQLQTTLTDMEYKNVAITVVGGSYGSDVQLTVTAIIDCPQPGGTSIPLPTKYDNSTMCLANQ